MEKTYENVELQKVSSDYIFTQEGIQLQRNTEKSRLIKYSDIKSMYLSMADQETPEVKAALATAKLSVGITQVSEYAWINILSIPKFHIAKINMTNKTVSEYLGNDVLYGFLYNKETFDKLLSHCKEHVTITSSVYRMFQKELDESFLKDQIPFTKRSILQEAQWKRKNTL